MCRAVVYTEVSKRNKEKYFHTAQPLKSELATYTIQIKILQLTERGRERKRQTDRQTDSGREGESERYIEIEG